MSTEPDQAHTHQPWANDWIDDKRVGCIQTTPAVARKAAVEGKIYVHRCGWAGVPPTIVAEVRVVNAAVVDTRTSLVRFETIRTLSATPVVSPPPGTNSYDAPEPR